MYDFYNNPPKNTEDIVEYLTSWLKPIEDSNIIIIYQNNNFFPFQGFRQAFNNHVIYLDKKIR